MIVEIRLYKRHDTDLVALCNAGYSISNMIKEALIGYANGTPVHFIVDEIVPFDTDKTKSVHTRFTMPDKEVKTCYLLRSIKKGYRNAFCKAILRNALIQQNLSCYYDDMNITQLQNVNLQHRNIHLLSNVIPCSTMKLAEKQVEFLGKKVKKENPKPIANAYSNPYANANPFVNIPIGYAGITPIMSDATHKNVTVNKKESIPATTIPMQESVQTVPVQHTHAPVPNQTSVMDVDNKPMPGGFSAPPPVLNIQELTQKAMAAENTPMPVYNKEGTHTIAATESQDDVVIEVADDDDLLKAFDLI